MKKIFTKKHYHSKFWIAAISVVVLCLAVVGIRFMQSSLSNKQSDTVNAAETRYEFNDKRIGKVESIMEYGDTLMVVAHYPSFENPSIDGDILRDVQNIIQQCKQEISSYNGELQGSLSIDYNSYLIDDKFISIGMYYEKNLPNHASTFNGKQSYVYDNTNGKRLVLGDIIDTPHTAQFIELVTKKVQAENDFSSEELMNNIGTYMSSNPNSFYLNDEGMVVSFDKYSILPGNFGAPSVTLPYNEIKNFFKKGFTVNSIKSHADIRQEINQQEYGKDNQNTEGVTHRKIDPNKPMVALTFDDGPHPAHTREILSALKKYNGAATFFVLGNRASSHGDVIREIINSGSEVANHSWSHKNYTKMQPSEIKSDKNKTQEAVKGVVGKSPKHIRVPYGAVNDQVKASVELPIILWNVDTNDWKDKNTALTIQRATTNIKDGDIILMHDIWGETAKAVPDIAKKLTEQGFQLVTINEMVNARGIQVKPGEKYFSFRK